MPEALDAFSPQLTGIDKAAILLTMLGVDHSASILQHMGEGELEQLLLAISQVGGVPSDVRVDVLEEAQMLSTAGAGVAAGGIDYTRQLLSRAVGPRRGAEILDRISAKQQLSSFEIVRNADPAHVASLLEEEHPQAIAVVLSYLESSLAAEILTRMPPEMQTDVTLRLAQMDRIAPQVIDVIERGLKHKLSSVFSEADFKATGGVDFLVKVLNQVDRGVQKTIFDALEETNPGLVEEIRANMFTFDDLMKLDDRAIQRILRDINKQDLALALKGTPENLREKIYTNLSERARDNLIEEVEILGPQLAKNVYQAQRKIVDVVRALEEAEEIMIAGGGGGDDIIY
ncbi:MAG: flagellar motor switch protein FliG [Anaerolineales bacterium]|nr:flagellar motor switch protein FliG [Anaerolineales bacterium]